jgi:hypothetical protein
VTRIAYCDCLGLVREERKNFSRLNSANLHALHAAALAAEDSNSGFRRFQKRGEIFADSLIRAVFDGGSLNANFQRPCDDSGDFVAAGTRLYAELKDDASVLRGDVELLPRSGVGTGAESAGMDRAFQTITMRVDTARAAQVLRAIPARRVAASTDRAVTRAPETPSPLVR